MSRSSKILSMASKRSLAFVTILLVFCLSYCMPISGLDISKHLVIENFSELGSNGGKRATKAARNSTRGDPHKEDESNHIHVHNAGYQSEATAWHGVRAQITVWKIPDVKPTSSSGAYIAASNTFGEVEFIAAGVHVLPGLYNDNNVHFFTYWTSRSDYSVGCYNVYCPGFVIANGSNLYPGDILAPPFSTYGGEQLGITIRIKKDEKTGDWSLYREDLGGPIGGMTLLGWWPSSLFQQLSDYAGRIYWTGIVSHNYNETSPSMGSGHYSSELDGKAASFNDCFGFDSNGDVFRYDYDPLTFEDQPHCYDVSDWYVTKHAARRHFFYGGPGCCHEQ